MLWILFLTSIPMFILAWYLDESRKKRLRGQHPINEIKQREEEL